MLRSLLVLAALALTVAACDSDPAVSAEYDVLPLAVGNSWTLVEALSISFDRETGLATDTAAVTSATPQTLTVVRDSLVAGERWARLEFTSERSVPNYIVPPEGAWFANRESSLYRLGESGDAELLYRLDVAPGAPFVSDRLKDVELERRETTLDVVAGRLPTAVFSRTEKFVEFPEISEFPVTPRVPTVQALSSTEGFVALEVLYVTTSGSETLVPFRLKRYELVSNGR